MNNKCWECGKELPNEQKTKRLLCDECKRKIKEEYIYASNKTVKF